MGRDLGRSILGKKLRFSQVTYKGHVRNSCMLLARFMPNSVLHHGEWVSFSGATPSQKTVIKNT
jgi:hypothetical protein